MGVGLKGDWTMRAPVGDRNGKGDVVGEPSMRGGWSNAGREEGC